MKFFLLLALALSALSAQEPAPAVRAVVVESAADSSGAVVHEGRVVFRIARGSIFLVKGAGLGPQHLVVAQPPYPLRLPEAEDGTRIEIRSLVTEELFNAPLIHSWAFQAAGIVPSAVPEGIAELRVIRGAAVSDPLEILVVNSSAAVFEVTANGGSPAAQVYRSPDHQPLIRLTEPARPGDTVILWATGLGPVEGDDNSPPVGTLRDDIRIQIADHEIIPDYAGRAPGQPGLDQINFRLPLDAQLPNHCYVPFRIEVGGASGWNSGRLSLAAESGPCAHPWGLPEETLRRLDEGGEIKLVELYLSQSDVLSSPINPAGRFGGARAMLASANLAAVNRSSPSHGAPQSRLQPLRWFGSPEGCSGVFSFSSFRGGGIRSPLIDLGGPFPIPNSRGLQVGDVLLTGPEGQLFELEQDDFGLLVDPPAWNIEIASDQRFPTPGDWTFRIGEGPELAALEHVVTLPDIDGLPQVGPIFPGVDRELSWDGSSFPESDQMTITVSVITERRENSSTGSGFSCTLPARSGEFVLPGSLLADLPDGLDGQALWTISINRGDGERVFEAEGVDRATWDYGFSRSGTVSFD